MFKPAEPISCLILEDEASSREMISQTLLESFPDIRQCVCSSIQEADEACQQALPALLILDINLPDGVSFDWLSRLLQQNQTFSVIFTTAYTQYAVEAFKFSALDFILKPFLPEELVHAVYKAVDAIGSRHYHLQLETLFHNLHRQDAPEKRIVLKTVEEIHVVNLDDIVAIEADNSYATFRLRGGQVILVSQGLKEFENRLRSNGFMRVHQSHLVHVKYISAFRKKTNELSLEGGIVVPVSLHKRPLLINYLNAL